ncbi:replication initiation protein [Zooshikella ganghwensis]|uniref:Replication initiation protein n=1 Tax=Zooshikella ganghwensis TaxID=202772 RepID=A0A4P9VH02_9GAMM|nr:replication initiation protein [Zooshikella ganghwensis]RDH41726.1 replication initiation protein [Zooshikella ganghwensis]
MEDTRIVVKENSFIDSYWNLSLAAHKIFAAIVANINPKDDEPPRAIQINKEQIKALQTGLSRVTINNRLPDIIRELMSFQVVLSSEVTEKGTIRNEGYNVFEAFNTEHMVNEKGEHVPLSVTLKFTETALPMIHGFTKNFTQYHLERIKKLESPYSARLYEILRRYHPIKKQEVTIVTIELERLKRMLKVEHKPGYKRYNNFRNEILLRTQKDIKKNTDLEFEFEGQRNGRKIDKIMFIVRPIIVAEAVEDESTLTPEVLPDSYDEGVAAMLASAVPELPEKVITLLASKLDGIAASQAFLSYTKAKQAGKVKDPAAYFLGILKHQEQQAKNSHNPDMDDMSWANRADFDEF